MRFLVIALFSALSGASLYAFVTRYWLHRDCIHASASSCLTPGGDNLTSGGMFWGILALGFAATAFYLALRNTSHR